MGENLNSIDALFLKGGYKFCTVLYAENFFVNIFSQNGYKMVVSESFKILAVCSLLDIRLSAAPHVSLYLIKHSCFKYYLKHWLKQIVISFIINIHGV